MPSASDWIRSWRLVSWRSALVAAVVLYAVIGFWLVPWVVKVQIEKRSLDILKRQATVEKVRCNPFALSLTVEGFSLPDRPGSVLLSFDRLYANAQLESLFRWAATLAELRIENPYVALRRFEDGEVNVLELLDDLETGEPKSEDEGGLRRALLHHVQVVDGRVDLEDRARPERLLWEMGPSQIELFDISTIPEREGRNDVFIGLPDGGSLSASGTVVVEPLGLEGKLIVKNSALATTWRAIAELFDFDMTSGLLNLDLGYRISLQEDGPHLIVDGAGIRVRDFGFQWRDHDVELLQVDAITVSGGHLEWPEQNVSAEAVVVEGATAFAWLEPDGTPSWDVLVPQESQEKIVEAYRTLEERLHMRAEVGRFEVRDSGAEFEDQTFSPPVRFMAHDVNLVVTDVTTKHGATWPFEASAILAETARGRIMGSLGASPLALDAEVELENLELARYRPYVVRYAPLDLRAGVLSVAGAVRANHGTDVLEASFEGGFGVTGLDLNETVTGGKLLGWGDLEVAGIAARLEPMSAEVRAVDIDRAGLEITVAEDGSINLLEFFKALSEGEETEGADVASVGAVLPPVHIARLQLRDCYGVYTDRTVSHGPFRMALTPINGAISGIATDSRGAARIDISADIDSGGLVRIEGELDPFDYTRLTDLEIDVRDMLLPAVSPMSVKFIGHPIVDGNVSLDLDYDISDRYLTAANHIEADDLVLDDKVEGEGMVNLPFKLGVSLLKDREGRITLDIPFEGSFDTPGFGMATAAGAAAKEIFSGLLKSPFRLLGKIGGGGDQDLEFVEFAAGSAILHERAARNLETLFAGLVERPTLALDINGSYDVEADGLGLRELAFREEALARGVSEEDLGTVIPLDVLESMYGERQSAEALEALRGQHTAVREEGAEAVLDEVAYRAALREALIGSQSIDDAAVAALAAARAEAVRTCLVDQAGLEPTRVSVVREPEVVTDSGRWVRCRLGLSAN